jgi:hypothetical protein
MRDYYYTSDGSPYRIALPTSGGGCDSRVTIIGKLPSQDGRGCLMCRDCLICAGFDCLMCAIFAVVTVLCVRSPPVWRRGRGALEGCRIRASRVAIFDTRLLDIRPGGNPGEILWVIQSTSIQMPPRRGGICGKLT